MFRRSVVAIALTSCFLAGLAPAGHAQQYTVRGYVEDADSGERLIGANLLDRDALLGATTNEFGFYSYTYAGDTLRLLVSYVGYQPFDTMVVGPPLGELVLRLGTGTDLATAEVVATEQSERIDERVQMSRIDVPVEQIKRAPALLGETDVLKALQLLPGVSGGSEGTAGLYVRGGSPDQNLVLLDGVPVYNVSHVLGIFSVFNADAISNVSLTKGGFPARYGGRLSSVLEINMRDGHKDKWHGEGGIGLISSRLTLDGPVGDKTRVLVSGRRTYLDLIAKPFVAIANAGSDYKTSFDLNFYDLNAKVRHEIDADHTLYASGYLGGDVFGIEYEDEYASGGQSGATTSSDIYGGGIRWGNKIGALRWNWELGPRLFLNTTATYSDYQIRFSSGYDYQRLDVAADTLLEDESALALYQSGIRDIGLKADLAFIPNPTHYLRTGGGVVQHRYNPGALQQRSQFDELERDTTLGSAPEDATEAWLYVEDEWRLGPRLTANVGLHASFFANETTYTSLQPRVAARYRFDSGLALKASYARMAQFVNLLTSEALALPTDLWVPANARVAPQRSWQAALGAARTLGAEAQYEVSAEAFYKHMDNVVSYRPGASFFSFDPGAGWESKVTQGSGEAYGIELLAQRKVGRTTGWVGYTLSWNNRSFEGINGGRPFPFRYDRRHDVSVLVTHELSERIVLSGAWVFGTGNAVTLPEFRQPGSFEQRSDNYDGGAPRVGFIAVEQGAGKNQYRLSNYHRLDVSVEFIKQKRWGERAWVLGAYNAYWHKNPFLLLARRRDVYASDGTYTTERSLQEISVLPIVPSLSYRFKF